MLQFLQPIWFLAAAGTIVPILIHLWNVKRGKTLKIGSIELLQPASRQAGRSLKLTDLLLLLLRCFIILLAAAALSGPVWKTAAPAARGWILIETQNRKETYRLFRARIDSLLKAGYELHDFNPGFARVRNLPEALLSNGEAPEPPLSYWTLLKDLDRRVGPEVPLWLFTQDRLARVHGTRPNLRLDLRWETYTADGHAEWISGADLLDPGKIRITRSRSDREGTTHRTEVIPAAGTDEVGTTFTAGKPAVYLKNSHGGTVVAADTAQTRITIYSDRPGEDQRYLRTALEAIRAYSERPVRLRYTTTAGDIPGNEDWLFWLSEKPVPPGLNARNRFVYATGRADTRPSVIRMNEGFTTGPERVPLLRKITRPPGRGQEPVWVDGFGDAVLAVKTGPRGADYFFFSRFDPAWNGLVWSPEFPAFLYGVLFSEPVPAGREDLRRTPQLQPGARTSGQSPERIEKMEARPLDKPFWLLLLLLFAVERVISYLKERRANG